MTDNHTQFDRAALKTMTPAEITKATVRGSLDDLLSGRTPPPPADDSKLQALKARLAVMTAEEITKTTRSGGFDDDLRGLVG
jgi:hypothetical protein